MEILKSLRYVKHLCIVYEERELANTSSNYNDGSFAHQRRPRSVRVRVYVLNYISILHPIVNKGELKDRHVDTEEWEDVCVG